MAPTRGLVVALVAMPVLMLPSLSLAGRSGTSGRILSLGIAANQSADLPFDNIGANMTGDNVVVVYWDTALEDQHVLELHQWATSIGGAVHDATSTPTSCPSSDPSCIPGSGASPDPSFQGQAINLTSTHLTILYNATSDALLQIMDSQEVTSVERDAFVTIHTPLAQTNAPQGLNRISSTVNTATIYRFDTSLGQGITAYIIDTGINLNHTEFSVGRAAWGANFVANSPDIDQHGHGTHCAGTLAGRTFGVAKNANIVAVKVLDSQGIGTITSIVQGLQFVHQDVQSKNLTGSAVVNMSLGGSFSTAINAAVAAVVQNGVPVIVAAGNDNANANNTSPASEPSAIVVGAFDSATDIRASFSNFGPALTVYAPGVNVVSSWIGSNIALQVLSGTSMASPHVAGVVAYLMALEGLKDPAAIRARVIQLAQATDAQVLNNSPSTTSLILNNGFR